MDLEVFSNINKIIERDSKSTTYKFALLRGVIDIIQDRSPFIKLNDTHAQIPTGLLIEKWILYYYPILESKTFIPQINGEAKLAFEQPFQQLISAYANQGGYSAFFNDLKNKGIPASVQPIFFNLAKKLRDTITQMPMKYIGRSISDSFYSIFTYENIPLRYKGNIDMVHLIHDFGQFQIPRAYYDAFQVLGSFISGQDSILFKWAEFSVNASQEPLPVNQVLDEVLKSPITLREIKASKKLYHDMLEKEGKVFCVWSGKKISNYDIDHLIPFSIWKNNDLWNLLPSDSKINQQKRDRIPTPNLIEKQKDLILDYWGKIYHFLPNRFEKEIQTALLGHRSPDTWSTEGILQLQNNCGYLIENRGFEKWEYRG